MCIGVLGEYQSRFCQKLKFAWKSPICFGFLIRMGQPQIFWIWKFHHQKDQQKLHMLTLNWIAENDFKFQPYESMYFNLYRIFSIHPNVDRSQMLSEQNR